MSDWEEYSSLKIHPGWLKVERWIQAESILPPHIMAQLAKAGKTDEVGNKAIRADALLSVIRHVDEQMEQARRKNEAKDKSR